MGEGPPKFEAGPGRPNYGEIEDKAAELWRMAEARANETSRSVDEMVDITISSLRDGADAAENPDNPTDLSKYYPGWDKEDLLDLAKILEAKK